MTAVVEINFFGFDICHFYFVFEINDIRYQNSITSLKGAA